MASPIVPDTGFRTRYIQDVNLLKYDGLHPVILPKEFSGKTAVCVKPKQALAWHKLLFFLKVPSLHYQWKFSRKPDVLHLYFPNKIFRKITEVRVKPKLAWLDTNGCFPENFPDTRRGNFQLLQRIESHVVPMKRRWWENLLTSWSPKTTGCYSSSCCTFP